MTKCLLSLFILHAFVGVALKAQLTNPNFLMDCSQDCVSERYPYKFCVVVNGFASIVDKCSADPNHEMDANQNPMIPYKSKIFLDWFCVNYDEASSIFVDLENNRIQVLDVFPYPDLPLTPVTFFNPFYGIEFCVNDARNQWATLCKNAANPGQKFIYTGTTNECCLNIFWSSDDTELNRNPLTGGYPIAVTWLGGLPGATSCNGFACENLAGGVKGPRIVLNQSNNFMKVNASGVPTNFYYTEDISADVIEYMEEIDLHYYHLCTVIMHEMGHFLGFWHPDLPPLSLTGS